jgi:hypothetical protein
VENWNTMEKPLACGTQRRSERIAAAAAATAAAAVALAGVLWQSWPLLRLLLSNAQCCKVESRSEYTPTLRVYGELPIRGEARRGEAMRSSGAVKAVASPVMVSVISLILKEIRQQASAASAQCTMGMAQKVVCPHRKECRRADAGTATVSDGQGLRRYSCECSTSSTT